MNLPGSEANKRVLAWVLGAVAVLALYYIYSQLWTGSSPTPVVTTPAVTIATHSPTAPAPERTKGAKSIATTAAALDPTLHMQQMRAAESVIYNGSGRNIFSAASVAAVAIPKPIQSARPAAVTVAAPIGPPPPPPIDLRYCGYFAGPNGTDRRVILVHGDDVVLARPGDIVLRRYKLVSATANAIQVEDMPNNNTQTLPLIARP